MVLLEPNHQLKHEEYNFILKHVGKAKNSCKNVYCDFEVCAILQFRRFNAHSVFRVVNVGSLSFISVLQCGLY